MNEKEVEITLKNILGKEAYIIKPLLGGMMNQSYIVSYQDKKYVLYIATKQANEMVDRELEKENQKIIIDLGLTSKNIYFDTKTGTKINEYLEGSSLDKEDSFDTLKVANLLKGVHVSKILSKEDYHPFNRFLNYEKEAGLYTNDFGDHYQELKDVLINNREFLESQHKCLCHNDAQKSNIVDSLGHYYIIDFEFMANNDPIYDIAAFGNNKVSEGYEVLNVYFNKKPSLEEKKRYYLWRIFISLQWHNVALIKHYRGEGKTHGFNFLDVATFFMNNALEAYQRLLEIK